MKAKTYTLAIGVGLLVLVVSASYHGLSALEAKSMAEGLRLARVAVDVADVRAVEGYLEGGMAPTQVVTSHEYREIQATLDRLRDSFSRQAQWLYIFRPAKEGAEMVVLTIPADKSNSPSLPGYLYPAGDYPAMREAMAGREIVVSKIVFDSVYRIWTRSGFIQLVDDYGAPVGVLGVDLLGTQILQRLATTALVILAYSAFMAFALLSLLGAGRKGCGS